LNYSCICCGTCCRKYQPWLTPEEVTKIAGQLNINTEKFYSDYTDRRWPGTESFLLVHVDNACVFLKTDSATQLSLCRIHAFKPACCLSWTAGIHKPECQAGLKKLFGITVAPDATLQATNEQLQMLAERLKLIDQLPVD
jgi:Fe-S-cluster containining protein